MQKAAIRRSRHIAPGDKLGKYEVIRQIAIGGMAELYLARTVGIEGFEKLVVVKRILPQYVSNASFVDMFLNEARLAATLHHPNIAQVYDIGLEDGDYFFAMEYVHGEDLDHVQVASEEQGVPIALDAALTLVAGLCAGLHYAHDKASPEGRPLQIVHRDVSPSNVLVSYDGSVKLVDFGIARAASRPGTTQGGLKGKIAYMSPEQCRSKIPLDRRSDLYAVGTILYQLTTGRLPFTGETEYQILSQIVNDDVPPPSTYVPSYPPALERIVLRALARDREQRFASALEMQGAVEDFAHESRLRVSPLVLGRLMGTLFPTRLEEWDSAKAQGAFFVEQHVVRTLIESGRTPDRSDPVTRAKVAAAVATDDDPTHVNHSLQDLSDDTTVGAPPLSTEPLTAPGVPAFTPAPPPRPSYPAMAPGTLFSSQAAAPVQPVAATVDVTERVRVPVRRQSSPTSFVRAEPRRRGVFLLLGLVAVAGGIAAFIITRGDDLPAASESAIRGDGQPAAESAAPTVEGSAAEEPVEVDPAPVEAAPAPVEVAAPEPAAPAPPVEPMVPPVVEPTIPAPVVAAEPKKSVGKVAAKPRPRPSKPAKKSEPKEQKTWNADSPFMPVRTK